jgi:pyroglutamyl-peptidase
MPLIVLLTGFEPFGGASYNPSGETALALNLDDVDAPAPDGIRMARIIGVRLPVLWARSAALLEGAVQKVRPDVVISLGEGDTTFRVEQFADDVRIHAPDNRGVYSSSEHTARTTALPTGLPIARIEAAIGRSSVSSSADAGGFICNEVFFRLMQFFQQPLTRGRLVRAGFIHVPNHTVVPHPMPQAAVNRAIVAAIRATLQDLSPTEYQRTQP